MRPGQQNRRMRGRNNNNRKGPNPLTRNYESNGPDVKIRGSAQQIAEKYATLARDAQSSGDRVMAENYLQHAEHYNRIILAAQAQMPIQQQVRDNRDRGDDFDDDHDDDRDDADNQAEGFDVQPERRDVQPERRDAQPERRPRPQQNDGSGPQPVIEGLPAEVAIHQAASGGGTDRQVNGSHVNGADAPAQAADGEHGEAPARRPRRPRRPRPTEAEGATGQPAGETSSEPTESSDVVAG